MPTSSADSDISPKRYPAGSRRTTAIWFGFFILQYKLKRKANKQAKNINQTKPKTEVKKTINKNHTKREMR